MEIISEHGLLIHYIDLKNFQLLFCDIQEE